MKFGVGLRNFEGWPELASPATGKRENMAPSAVFFYDLSCELLGNISVIV